MEITPKTLVFEKKISVIATVNTVAAIETDIIPNKNANGFETICPVWRNIPVINSDLMLFDKRIIPKVAKKVSKSDDENAENGDTIRINVRIKPSKFKESAFL